MNTIQKIGIGLFCVALAIFTLSLGLSKYQLTTDNLPISNEYHAKAIIQAASNDEVLDKVYSNNIIFIAAIKKSNSIRSNGVNQPIYSRWGGGVGL